jgi:hypothetical protein
MQKKHVIKKLEEKINENIKTDNSSKGTDTSGTPYKKILENCPNLKGKETASSALMSPKDTLRENMRKDGVITISGPEKTIVISDDTTCCSDEELKIKLEQDKQVKKEIRKSIDDSKKIVDKIREVRTNNTTETLYQNLLEKYPNLKEKTSALIKDNNPLEENEQNRVSVTTDGDKNFIQNSKKYVEEHIIPRKKELERIEEATRNIQNLSIPLTEHYEEVNHPDHYNVYDVEVVEMMERIFGIEETMSWCKLNAFKYRMRAGEKPTSTVEKDLKKEKWCLNKYRELKSKI